MTFVDDDRLLDDDLIHGASVGKHLDERWSAQLTGYSSDFDNDGLRPEWTWPATFDGSRTVQLRPEVRSRGDLQSGNTLNDLVAQVGLAFGFGPPRPAPRSTRRAAR